MSSIEQRPPESIATSGAPKELAYLNIDGAWIPIQVIQISPEGLTYRKLLGNLEEVTIQVDIQDNGLFYYLEDHPYFPGGSNEQ